jgi:hypothetical protein
MMAAPKIEHCFLNNLATLLDLRRFATFGMRNHGKKNGFVGYSNPNPRKAEDREKRAIRIHRIPKKRRPAGVKKTLGHA